MMVWVLLALMVAGLVLIAVGLMVKTLLWLTAVGVVLFVVTAGIVTALRRW